MNKEEFDINQELDQMRQDYANLKEQFDKQQIINEQLMEKAFKSDIRWLTFDKKSTPIAGIALVLVLISFSIWRNVPWNVTILLSAFMMIATLAVSWVYKKLSLDTLFGEDILTATKRVRRFKQQYLWLLLALWAALLVILGALSPMIYRIWSPSGKTTSVFVMLAVGIIISAVVNVFSFRRIMQACDKVVERLQLKDDTSTRE